MHDLRTLTHLNREVTEREAVEYLRNIGHAHRELVKNTTDRGQTCRELLLPDEHDAIINARVASLTGPDRA